LRQGDLSGWRFLILLDESVQYPDPPFGHEKYQPRDPVVCELAAHFSKSCSERSAEWHSNRPSDLHRRKIDPDGPAIFG
jgi:hypothetical protein